MRQVIRTSIVHDDRPDCTRIRELLAGEDDIEVVGEYRDARSAFDGLQNARPDLLFLEAQVRRDLSILERIGTHSAPAIIFVAAHERYALRAFELNAIDYLMNPLDAGRFRGSIERVRNHLATGGRAAAPPARLVRLAVRTRDRIRIVRLDDVDWIDAAGNYVCLHVAGETHHYRDTLNAFETRLDPQRFVRIHRSAIVNIDRVVQLEPDFHREHRVVLRDGTHLKLTSSYRQRLESLVGPF